MRISIFLTRQSWQCCQATFSPGDQTSPSWRPDRPGWMVFIIYYLEISQKGHVVLTHSAASPMQIYLQIFCGRNLNILCRNQCQFVDDNYCEPIDVISHAPQSSQQYNFTLHVRWYYYSLIELVILHWAGNRVVEGEGGGCYTHFPSATSSTWCVFLYNYIRVYVRHYFTGITIAARHTKATSTDSGDILILHASVEFLIHQF